MQSQTWEYWFSHNLWYGSCIFPPRKISRLVSYSCLGCCTFRWYFKEGRCWPNTSAAAISIARIPLIKGANTSGTNFDSTCMLYLTLCYILVQAVLNICFLGTSVNGVLFTVIEPATVLICSSLPMLPRLFSRLIIGKSKIGTSGNLDFMSPVQEERITADKSLTSQKGRAFNLAGRKTESTEAFELTLSTNAYRPDNRDFV